MTKEYIQQMMDQMAAWDFSQMPPLPSFNFLSFLGS